MDLPARTPTHDRILQLRIIPFKDRLDFRILTMVIKVLNKSAPPYIDDMFSTMPTVNRMNTRSCARRDLQIPTVRLNLTKQGLRYQGATLYNTLNKSNNLSDISVHNFKKLFIKTYFNSF